MARANAAVSDGVLPTFTPAASRASFLAAAVPDEPDTMAPAWPMAGDQIATVGNRGNSTGPHLHFEVLLNGTQRIDPVPWLAQRGLSPGNYVG